MSFVVAFLALAVATGIALSVAAVALEELSFRRYTKASDLWRLLAIALIENFGYRQLATIWRVSGIISAVRGDDAWGVLVRRGFTPTDREAPLHPVEAASPQPALDR